jgi:DNA/RNA-binding domain of Phe-tRNA-synthetase-like protein
MPEPIISPDVLERFPHYCGSIVHGYEVPNQLSSAASNPSNSLRVGELNVRVRFQNIEPHEDPHIDAWRKVFKSFGVRPNQVKNSLEALVCEVLAKGELHSSDELTDSLKWCSMYWNLPIRCGDLDKIVGSQRLEFASGLEAFTALEDGIVTLDSPQPGEVIWKDEEGVVCRAWNWKQAERVKITEATRNFFVVFEGLLPFCDDLPLSFASDQYVRFQTSSATNSAEIFSFGANPYEEPHA